MEGKAKREARDHHAIEHNVETLRGYDTDFEKNHFALVQLANEEELEAEQVILDNHINRVVEFSDLLLHLLPHRYVKARLHLIHLNALLNLVSKPVPSEAY